MSSNMPYIIRRELPHGLSHAVERLSLGFEWGKELDSDTMRGLADLGPTLEADLPRRFEISTSDGEANYHQCAGEGQSLPEGANLYALMFDDNADSTRPVEEKHTEIVINESGLFFTVLGRYDGWDVTRSRAKKLCDVFLKRVFEITGLNAVEIRVNNVFFLERFSAGLDSLLNMESDSLPLKIFKAPSYWHVNEGYYVEHADPDMNELLVNLTVVKANVSDEDALSIRTIHRFDTDNTGLNFFNSDQLFDKFDHLHAINKRLLGSLVHRDISDALNLFPKGGES